MAESESKKGMRLVMYYDIIDLGCSKDLDLDNIIVTS